MVKKLSYEYVSSYFNENGCELLEADYKNNRTLMRYICECGNESKIKFDNFKNGQRCRCCSYEKTTSKTRLSLGEVKQIFLSQGCLLLEEEYKNASTKLNYRCSCGNIAKITLSNFKAGNRCNECKRKKSSERMQIYSNDKVREILFEKNLILLSEYKGYHDSLKYKCMSCGYLGEKSLNSIEHSQYSCRNCYKISISGENSIHWKSDLTDEERNQKRLSTEDYYWKQKVKERDNYTCQCCGDRGGKLHAHHILNYSQHEELRHDLENGITLCENCHRKFHSLYGIQNNNGKQLEEFISNT